MAKTYQWTKGDRIGTIAKTMGETFIEDNIEYLVFTDGKMINTALINEFLLEIPSESEGLMMQDLAPAPLQRVEKKKNMPEPLPQTNYVQQVELSPIERLLLDCKKIPTTFNLSVEVQLPSLELIKVLSDSYEHGEEQVLDFLASSIHFQDVKNKIVESIKDNILSKEKIRKNGKLQANTQREKL